MSKCHAVIFVVPAVILFAGCSEPLAPVAEPVSAREESVHQVLRVKEDLARGRRWELGWGAAYVYDAASGQLIRRIPLPAASFAAARAACLGHVFEPFGGADRLDHCHARSGASVPSASRSSASTSI